MAKLGQAGWQAAEGTGCLVWNASPQVEETVTWSGPCQDNRASGEGELIWRFPGNEDHYVGYMRNGKRHGQGKAVSPQGDRYEGNWVDGKLHGHGAAVSLSGDRYEGDWVNGRPHGQGVKTYANGDRYNGNFVNGMRTRGRMTKPNGDWYEGEWSGKFADGKGQAKINGKMYDGIWARGCLRNAEQRIAWDRSHQECS